jgi:glutaredoxin-like protein
MDLLSERDRQAIRDRLRELIAPVKLLYFTQELECSACRETGQLLRELVGLSDQLTLQILSQQLDRDAVEKYRIDKIPATVVLGGRDYGLRFYGVPGGYEFVTLLDAILAASVGESGLSGATMEKVMRIDRPVHLQVLVTPTCPYCPSAVRLAQRMAMANDLVTADMVEATQFPHLVQRYHVKGVPRTVVNEAAFIDGALPEAAFVDRVLEALEKQPSS